MNRIYLDNAATTKISDEVLDAMMPFLKENYGNASSIHSFGKTAKVMLEDARDTVAEFLGAGSKEIFFTNSGTESNNFALKGTAMNFLNTGRDHIITSSVEHSAVIDTMKYLRDKFGFKVTFLKPDEKGRISIDDVSTNIRPETFLISIMHSNNETGVLNDVSEIVSITREKNIIVHSDTVQSIGKTDINVRDLDVNLATLSAHKIYGPKGIAALYVKDKTPVEKFIHGGMQERNMRGGTENIASIAGLKKAIEILRIKQEDDIKKYSSLKSHLISMLKENFSDGVLFNSDEENSLPNIVNISFDSKKLSYDEEMLLIQLDLKGVAVSGGSACTAGTHKPSYVLTELGRDYGTALGSVRISFGRENTIEDIDKLVDAFISIVKRK